MHYGIELAGWLDGLPFTCPSSLPATLEPLQKLLQKIDDGECYLCRLSPSERAQRRAAYNQSVLEGAVAPRGTRSDKGKMRAPYHRRKGRAAQDTDDGEDGEDGDEADEAAARGKKRARKSRKARAPTESPSASESDD